MNHNVLVSIVVPIYNTEPYVEATILSVEEQTYKNIELICIDDGTKDNAFEICRHYSTKYNNIVLLQNELHPQNGTGKLTRNHGLEYTRNHGLKVARGQYVMFLDSDDTLAPDTLEQLVKVSQQNITADIIMFTYADVREGIETPILCQNMQSGPYGISEFSKKLLSEVKYPVMSCVGSKMYKLSFLRQHNLWFDKKYKYNEDAGFILSCLQCDPIIYFLNNAYYKYFRRTVGSIMTSHRSHQFLSVIETRKLIKELFIKHDLWNEKKDVYFESVWQLMYMTLDNDIRYGTKKDFFDSLEDIYEFDDLIPTIESCEFNKSMTKAMRASLFLLKHRMNVCLYALMRMRKWLKG